jgi:diguanylate cyclase (GGDEF)-like protein
VVIAALAIGLCLSVVAAVLWAGAQRADQRRAFHTAAQNVSATLASLVGRDADFVATVGTVLTMSPDLTPTQFAAWYARLQGSQRQVGGIGSADLYSVPAGQLLRFEARRDMDPAFRAVMGDTISPVIPDGRARYCLIGGAAVIAPLSGLLGPLLREVPADWCNTHQGFGATEAAMLQSSADTDRLLVDPVSLGSLSTTILHMPFYRRGAPTGTVAERRANLRGWVISSFDMRSLIQRAIGDNRGLSVGLRFLNPDGTRVLLASVGDGRGQLSEHTPVSVDGMWSVAVRGAPVVSGTSAASQGVLILAAGTVVTLLLSLLILTLSRSRERAMAMVAEKTGQLRHQALHDPLTGLPNRVLALDRAEQMLARARRAETPVAGLYIDIDGFKHINDSFGHAVGDLFLKSVAARLQTVVRESDTAARLSGDEFVVLLEGDILDAGAEMVAERVLDVLREPYDLTAEIGRELSVSASIGVAYGCPGTAEELLADADVALYSAKEAGRDRYVMFESGMQTAAQDRIALELDLADALLAEELFLVYQPTFDLKSERTTGVEALLRWRHPTRGVIAPDVFIPIAERSGLILSIGRWVLQAACRQAANWREEGHELAIAVNVSGRQLDRDELIDDVHEALMDAGLEPSALTIEITETALMRDPEGAAARLGALKQLGVRVAIDDFGTGYSSLAYLSQFPVDTLKIDRAFVQGIAGSKESAALVQTLIELGRSLGLETLGEGIEELAQLEHLQHAGCDSGQGFLFARPLDAEALGAFLDGGPPAAGQAVVVEA